MADEISLSVAASYSKSGQDVDASDLDLIAQSIDVSGSHYIRRTMAVSTSAAALDIGSITTCGLLIGRNRGAQPVHIRAGSGGTNTITFPVGAGFAVYLATNTPYAVTSSSTSTLEYILIEA